MSATDQIRAMLDGLMGTERQGSGPRVEFDDPGVCKTFLLGCCPHDILTGTRMDIGECRKIHGLALKADYEKSSRKSDFFYEYDALKNLETFIGDCDRRTEQSKQRLIETQEELSDEGNTKSEEVNRLGEEIGTKLARAEQLGADGAVEESLKLMSEVEELGKVKSQTERELRDSMPSSSYQQQKLRVCEVCSAFLGVHDNDRRLADHFGGKLHLGFIAIRNRLEELRTMVAAGRPERTTTSSSSRHRGGDNDRRHGSRHRSHSRDRDRRHGRHGSRESGSSHSSHHRSRHHGSSSRHRSRSPGRRTKSSSRSKDVPVSVE